MNPIAEFVKENRKSGRTYAGAICIAFGSWASLCA